MRLKNEVTFAGFLKKSYLCRTKKTTIMDTFFQSHRKGITLASNLVFWFVTCYCFVRFSVLRPVCNTHIYKEFICVGLIATVVFVTQRLTIPNLFLRGRYIVFWIVSACVLLLATFIEIRLVKSDLLAKVHIQQNITSYMLMISVSVLFRDSCFFAWFLVFRLYTLQKDTFRAKQRASVMEHQSVQFSTPDQKEISIPIDIMVFIQEVDHTTQVHCTQNNIVTVLEPLSHCKKMIPTTLWTSEGSDKMVFHKHLSEFLQTQNKPEVREIKYITLLSERQFRIFEIIHQNPGCNTTFLYESFRRKVTQRTIERDLEDMREKNVISHVGDKKTGGYEICTLNVISKE